MRKRIDDGTGFNPQPASRNPQLWDASREGPRRGPSHSPPRRRMSEKREDDFKGRAFQTAVTAAGLLLWGAAVADIAARRAAPEQLTLLALAPLALVVGVFPITFPLPSGLRFTTEKISFTLSDAFTLLVACRYGVLPAVFLAGLEGFVSSRATVRRLSSNLFSSGMMSLAAGGGAGAAGAGPARSPPRRGGG